MPNDVFSTAARLRADGTPFVLATVVASVPPQSVRPGAKAIVYADGAVEGWVGGGCVRPVVVQEAAEALGDGRPRLVRINVGTSGDAPSHHGDVREYPMTCQGEGGVEIYLEPVLAAPRLVVLGHTPVAQSLARIGAELGFDVVVASPGAQAEAFPPDARVAENVEAALAAADASTFVVIATMGAGDEEALAAAAASDADYVGLVASRKKGRALVDYVHSSGGASAERLARVKYPAGLDLGGMRAPEIALSIVAEIVERRNAGVGGRGSGVGEVPRDVPSGVVPTPDPRPPTRPSAAAERRPPRALSIAPFPVDPVCGMPVNPAEARHTLTVGGETLYFCCPHCKATYEKRLPASPGAKSAEEHA
ncbi:MAG TPA: XdhC family protein [Gemmatimonadaceae bacterium]|nr:XdhC family protein [Gemmatimonadaceae bacterium]